MEPKKKKLNPNVIFTAVVLAVALALFAYTRLSADPGLTAHIQYDTDPLSGAFETLDVPLDEDARYDLDSGDYTIHIQIKDGAAAFVESPCPDHLCEHYGWLDENGEWAACLPAGAVLTIEAPQG